MLNKQKTKEVKSLQLSKFRQIYNKFVAEGDKVATEFIKNPKYFIEEVFITHASIEKYAKIVQKHTKEVTAISEKEMSMMSGLKTPSDILVLLHKSEDSLNSVLNNCKKAIYLDGVQDPGNVGTIIRIADWFGISCVVRSNDSADFFNPKVVQSSMGSMNNISLISGELSLCKPYFENIIGTYMEGENTSLLQKLGNGLLVMGSEGGGIKTENDVWMTHKVTIQGHSSKIAESLNVSVAAGILCSKWV